MKKYIIVILLLILSNISFAQEDIYPVYRDCDSSTEITLESCFYQNITTDVLANFTVPERVKSDNYKGTINVVFIVNKDGNFEVLYVRSTYKELEDEVKRVFAQLPKAIPATYNGRPIEMRFGMPISIPLDSQLIPQTIEKQDNYNEIATPKINNKLPIKNDIENAVISTRFPEHRSELNIPFTYQKYNEMSFYYNQNDNSHTGFKPYQYSEAIKHVDLDAQKTALLKDKKSWGGRKFWNEHFFKVQENVIKCSPELLNI